jgi:UDP-N-acetylmuramoyl-L-alanyl-D-glutamate--2,6-diaminopimelate ligase
MISSPPERPPRTLADWARRLGGRLAGPAAAVPPGAAGLPTGLADDSREVLPGHLFFARRGRAADGLAFARAAVAAGAAAVVTDDEVPADLPALLVPDVAAALEAAADLWYARPQDALDLVAVTGTKGKTTTARLVAAALRGAGVPTAVLGTIGHDLGAGPPEPAANTTPGLLAAAVLEVASHALDPGRTAGLAVRAALFTNLGRDHLDYHGDLEAYLAAKRRLFEGLERSAAAVLNATDPVCPRLAAACRGPVLTYGDVAGADLRAEGVQLAADRTRFRLRAGERDPIAVETPLVGRHNVLNLLAAVGAATTLGVDLADAVRGAESLAGVRGRLERVTPSGDLHVFVDYAHTEESLREVLGFLRGVGAVPLTCVIGCGGDRDRTKRPRMARAAAELAERAILTSDNPRTEDPARILDDMTAGLDDALRARTLVLPDRREAIRRAVAEAPPGGTVLVAGKGHEDYQILGTTKVPFDDAEEARTALRPRLPASERDTAWGPPRG